MTLRYLADTSAIIRVFGGTVADQWTPAVAAGVVGICDPVELEILRGSGSAQRRRVRAVLRGTYPWCPVPENVWDRAIDLQDQLADTSLYVGASIVDLVVAVTARHRRLAVLHDDADYETMSRMTGLPAQRVVE